MGPVICAPYKHQEKREEPKKKAVFGTLEWASCNGNFIDGCKHDCKYCYSKSMAIRFKRRNKHNWGKERIRYASFRKQYKKIEGTMMVPSSHDMHPDNLEASLAFLNKVLSPGNSILIVSKPHLLCITTICEEFARYKEQILFRFTIGSSSSKTLKFWEPYAPSFEERMESLKHAYSKGFNTSISCEPMLDNNIESVIEQTDSYVTDAIWLGKVNSLMGRLKINGVEDIETKERARELLNWQSDKNISKLYSKLKNNQKIKWKESIKNVVGIEVPTKSGLDV